MLDKYRVGMIPLLLLNPLTEPICPLEPTCDSCISALAPLHGVRTCENTGRGELGSVISQCVINPNVLADYRSAKHPSLALVATSNPCDT